MKVIEKIKGIFVDTKDYDISSCPVQSRDADISLLHACSDVMRIMTGSDGVLYFYYFPKYSGMIRDLQRVLRRNGLKMRRHESHYETFYNTVPCLRVRAYKINRDTDVSNFVNELMYSPYVEMSADQAREYIKSVRGSRIKSWNR
ncbi:MAG: hypothetical protein IJ560_02245 [Alphaproteobacteria bacterium]|nr:hypothetical protein [Alphaproteobacteria bacterium]